MLEPSKRIVDLIKKLNKASEAYYVKGEEVISNLEYDKLYDELVSLEMQTGIIMGNSPTQKVGFEVAGNLPKEKHGKKMLSLGKTKEKEELVKWLGDMEGLLSWKLDGLTVVITYDDGKLNKAVTRGNGEIGEVITANARMFKNLPINIPYKGRLIIRGEAVISYEDFKKINNEIIEVEGKYKNPRNLCSGSVRQLNSEITSKRNVNFYAFSISETKEDFNNSRENCLKWLEKLGIEVVPYKKVNKLNLIDAIEEYSRGIKYFINPSDGLVLTFDDIKYSENLGSTAKFPRDSIAFKWEDQIVETEILEIEWSPSRTGLLNPIAIFKPIEIEGTTVKRASLHNLSVLKELKLGIGDIVKVYKANMIIPQVSENLTKSDSIIIPKECPVCKGETKIINESSSKTLICTNPQCPAKQTKAFTLFVSRDALNIDGLSENTILKLMGRGHIKKREDLFRIGEFKDEIAEMEGFGEKSVNNLLSALESARKTTPERVLYALGIPGVGVANAKLICRYCENNWNKIVNLKYEELIKIDGIGKVIANDFVKYFESNNIEGIINNLEIDETFEKTEKILEGKTFVITGSLISYGNRDELKKLIESKGGKVANAVTNKTSYLVNNDINSNSGKNKKAKELNIPIINEEMLGDLLK
ncbi:MAG TPA: NAD-dependent DNA ligase LigA [Anaerovoracaceae bacterium]|nr:NAD-dependent DNA ligase LigA [Anaerovoracaceae bacterium]